MLDKIAILIAVIGALNWGGIGLFGFDTVAFLFGGQLSVFSRIIYALVGLAGLWCPALPPGRRPLRCQCRLKRQQKYPRLRQARGTFHRHRGASELPRRQPASERGDPRQ